MEYYDELAGVDLSLLGISDPRQLDSLPCLLPPCDTENILDAEAVIVVLQGDYHHDEVLEEELSIAQELDKNIILVVDEHFDLSRMEELLFQLTMCLCLLTRP